jgi:3-oxoacyl-[acyl-carrier-protein] synthase-3
VVYLKQIGTFVPRTTVTVRDLGADLGLTESKVRLYRKFLGFDRVAVAPDAGIVDLLVPAGRDALRGVDPAGVRYLIYAHTIQHIAPPSHRVLDRVRDGLGLSNATAFALSHQNCAAGLYAVQVAQYLLHGADPDATALILAGEKATSGWMQLIPGTAIMGEATAACLVGAGAGGDRVLGVSMRILGEFYRGNECSGDLKRKYDQMYAETMCSVIRDALDRGGVDITGITAVLPNNVNRFSWRQISRNLEIPLDRFYLDNISEFGHCFSADPFINLAHARRNGRVKPGDHVLLVSSGLGAIFAALVLRVGEGALP